MGNPEVDLDSVRKLGFKREDVLPRLLAGETLFIGVLNPENPFFVGEEVMGVFPPDQEERLIQVICVIKESESVLKEIVASLGDEEHHFVILQIKLA